MKTADPSRALAVGAALVTIALTAAAFWLSYEHLHDIAAVNGLAGARAWAWPATVDLFIVAGELLILRASLRGAVDRWAIALAASGSLGSIALNVAGVGVDAQPMEYVVAAVPPTAALIAFGALMRQVHEALQRIPQPVQPQPAAAPDAPLLDAADNECTPAVEPQPAVPQPLVLDLAPMQPVQPHLCAPDVVRPIATPETDAQLLKAALTVNATALAETGRPASLRRLQSELGIGQRRAQRIQPQLPRTA